MNYNKKFDIFSLIIGLFSLYVGYMIVQNPGSGLLAVVATIGIFAITRGIYQLWLSSRLKNTFGNNQGWLIFSAVVDIILGIIFIINLNVGVATLVFILAFWFIIDGIAELSISSKYHLFSKGYYWLIVLLASLSIIAGIILLFNPLIGPMLIVVMAAAYFFMAGILEIVEAF